MCGAHRNQTGLGVTARIESTAQTRLVLPRIDSDDCSYACRCFSLKRYATA
jgi:hypothetical protein